MPTIDTKTVMEQAGETFMLNVERFMREHEQIVSGKTLASIKYTTTDTSLTVTAPRYVGVLQEGRSAGKMPPVQPIIEWLRAKGVAGDEKKLKSIAFAIAIGIKNRGTRLYNGSDTRFTKPTGVFQQAKAATLEELRTNLVGLLRTQLRGAVINGFK